MKHIVYLHTEDNVKKNSSRDSNNFSRLHLASATIYDYSILVKHKKSRMCELNDSSSPLFTILLLFSGFSRIHSKQCAGNATLFGAPLKFMRCNIKLGNSCAVQFTQ